MSANERTVAPGDGAIPLVVDIKRHSLEDGPGIRSVVFFKGCPMRCVFCHSPETQELDSEIVFSRNECIKCERCIEVCPARAIDPKLPGRIDKRKCTRRSVSDGVCRRCVDACPGQGLREVGRQYTVNDLVNLLRRDVPYFRYSKGGVTLSGGECTMHLGYLRDLLEGLTDGGEKIHVTLETSGLFDYAEFASTVLDRIDLIYYDLKVIDREEHIRHTQQPNDVIIQNLHLLFTYAGERVRPRVPIIPDITTTPANLKAIADLVLGVGAKNLSLLSYNPMGVAIGEGLGRPDSGLPASFMDPKREEQICNQMEGMLTGAGARSIVVERGLSGGTTWFRWR